MSYFSGIPVRESTYMMIILSSRNHETRTIWTGNGWAPRWRYRRRSSHPLTCPRIQQLHFHLNILSSSSWCYRPKKFLFWSLFFAECVDVPQPLVDRMNSLTPWGNPSGPNRFQSIYFQSHAETRFAKENFIGGSVEKSNYNTGLMFPYKAD